jgi:DNA-binding Lrp family transcriptional regulator
MVLTRQEKERIVLDLYNQRTPIREIAKQAGMSFRDIGSIVDKAEEEKEAKEGQAQQTYMSTQAYKLFSEAKTLVQVAINLNLRENEVTQYYREYCTLTGLTLLMRFIKKLKRIFGIL